MGDRDKQYKKIMERAWFQDVVEEETNGEYSHLYFPHLGVNGLRPGRKVSCDYGQDTVRRVLYNASFQVRLASMSEVVPACGEEDCCAPRHSVVISRSTAQTGRTRGVSVADLLAHTTHKRPDDVVPSWSKKWPVNSWGDLRSGMGQTGALMIWKLAKSEMVRKKPHKAHGPGVVEYAQGMPYYTFNLNDLIGKSEADYYGVARALRGDAPALLDQLHDVFMSIPRSPWFLNKIEQAGHEGFDFRRWVARIHGTSAIGLFLLEDTDLWWDTIPIMTAEEEQEMRLDGVEVPEPD